MKYRNIFRISLAIFVAIILVTTIFANATIRKIERESTEKEGSHLIYRLPFSNPKITAVKYYDKFFSNIEMYDCVSMAKKPGEPALPVYGTKILLPYQTEAKNIKVYGESIKYETKDLDLREKPVIPHQEPVPIGYGKPSFIMNHEIYDSDKKIPDTLYDIVDVGYCRGYTILTMNIYPVEYIPKDGLLFYYPEVTVDVELEETGHVNKFFRNNPEDMTWVESLVINPEIIETYNTKGEMFSYPGGICDPSDSYDYVIIVRQALSDFTATYNWDDFINKKAMEGLSATVVTVEDIDSHPDYQNSDPLFDDQPAHIREFCKDAYQDWGTQYILIAGDHDNYVPSASIPRRLMKYNYEDNVESDLYWSNLDNTFNADHDAYWGEEGDNGFDLYSELFIGSIPCDTTTDISNWLTKNFFYADALDKDYLDNAAFYGGDTGWNCQGDDFIDFTLYGTNNWLGPDPDSDGPWPNWLGFLWGFDTWNASNPGMEFDTSVRWTAEPPNPGWQGGSESAAINGFRNAINNDQVTLISGIAHANSDMSLDVYAGTWESEYHNTKPFFIHDYGCHCGDMSASDDGVLHSMLFHSDTELAFACVYNTCYGWGNLDSTNSSSALQQKLFWDYMLNTSKSGGTMNWQLGKAQAYSKDVMAPTINWDYSTGTWRAIIQGCLLFGDPAQSIKPPLLPEHNIGVQSLDVEDHVNPGETILVNATLINSGRNNETNVYVSFRVNGTELDSTIIPFFQKQTSQQVSFSWTPALGWYNVAVNVTIPGVVENVTIDNEKTEIVIAGPDVEVTSIDAPSYASVDIMSTVESDITNLGANDEIVTVDLIVDGSIVDTVEVFVASKQTQHLYLVWNPPYEGTYPLSVKAFVPGDVYVGNNQKNTNVQVMTSQGFVLLVDDDKGDDYESYYENALMASGYIYEYWDRSSQGCPDPSYMLSHMAVVWFTGDDYTTTLTSEDTNKLSTYLNSGGKLFISGQDIGYDIRTDPFYSNYLHAVYNVDDTNIYDLIGQTGDPIGDGLTIHISSGDGANNQNYPEGISTTGGSTPVFQYQGSSHLGGLKYEGIYKVVYFGFGFEAINSMTDRTTVMQRIMNWLGGGTISVSDLVIDDMNLYYLIPSGTTINDIFRIRNHNSASDDLTYTLSFVSSNDNPISWASSTPNSGVISPGGYNDITLTIDTVNLTNVFTNIFLKITTNDPDEYIVKVPIYISFTNELIISYDLYSGWNLITIPVENNYTASDLALLIPECDMIAWW
ncbi:MAG: hypothetical protein DRQ06_03880, partial [Candidatus Hydrothermota bacterium]